MRDNTTPKRKLMWNRYYSNVTTGGAEDGLGLVVITL